MKKITHLNRDFRPKNGWQAILPFLLFIFACLVLSGPAFTQPKPADDKINEVAEEIKIKILDDNQVKAYSNMDGSGMKEVFTLIKQSNKNAATLGTGDPQWQNLLKGLEKADFLNNYKNIQKIIAENGPEGTYYIFLKYLQDNNKNDFMWQNHKFSLKRLPEAKPELPARPFYLERKGGELNYDNAPPNLTQEDKIKIEKNIKNFPLYGNLDPNNDLVVLIRDKTSVDKLAMILSEKTLGTFKSKLSSTVPKWKPVLFTLLGFLVAMAGLWGSTWYFSKSLDFKEKVEPQKSHRLEPNRNISLDLSQFDRSLQSINQRLEEIKNSLPNEKSLNLAISRGISGLQQTLSQSMDPMIKGIDQKLSEKLQYLTNHLAAVFSELSEVKSDLPSKVQGLKQDLSNLYQITEKLVQRIPDPVLHLNETDGEVYAQALQVGSQLLAFSEDEVRQYLPPKSVRGKDSPGALVWSATIEEFYRNNNTVRLTQFVNNLTMAIAGLRPLTKSATVDTSEAVQQELDSLVSACLGPAKVLLFRLKLISDRTGIPLDEETSYRISKLEEIIGEIDNLIAKPPFNLVPVRLLPFAKYPTFKESCLSPIQVEFSTYFPRIPRPASEDLVLLDVREWAFQRHKEWLFGRKAEVVLG